MGGFSGQDPAPTVATLAGWVQQGRLRFVLTGRDGRGGEGPGGGGPGGEGRDGLAGRAGRGGLSTQRTQWVQQHCAVVDPASYGGSVPARRDATEPLDRTGILYYCQAG
jgi:hypothetical protein